MTNQTVSTFQSPKRPGQGCWNWRTIDIMTVAMVGVVCGLLYWVYGATYSPISALFNFFPPAGGLIVGVWFIAAPLAALITRKAGAALIAELVAAAVSATLGNQWGLSTLLSGLMQGLGYELAFALFAYANWRLTSLILGGIACATLETIYESYSYYAEWSFSWLLAYGVAMAVSGIVISSLGAYGIVNSLRKTGVLRAFASGKAAQKVAA